ncbi:hypothetical protein D3C80_1372530 [compost metagenome]
MALGRHREPVIGLTLGQVQVVQVNGVLQATNGQARIVGVVDAKMQFELLFQQPGFDHFDLDQTNLGVFEVAGQPGRAATKAQQDEEGEENAGSRLYGHRTSPAGPSFIPVLLQALM